MSSDQPPPKRECRCSKPCKPGCKKRKEGSSTPPSRTRLRSSQPPPPSGSIASNVPTKSSFTSRMRRETGSKHELCHCTLEECSKECTDRPCYERNLNLQIPCDNCDCSAAGCNPACEEEMHRQGKFARGRVCDICACMDPCHDACEIRKRDAQMLEAFLRDKCACYKDRLKMCGPCLTVDATSAEELTASEQDLASKMYNEMARAKDLIFEQLKKEYLKHNSPRKLEELYEKVARQNKINIPLPTDALPVGGTVTPRSAQKIARNPKADCTCCRHEKATPGCECIVTPEPLEFTHIRQLDSVSVFLMWRPARSHEVIGYEICVNGLSYLKVTGRATRAVVVTPIEIRDVTKFAIYALTQGGGKAYPASTAVLKND